MTDDELTRRVQAILADELQLDVGPEELDPGDLLHAPHIRLDSLGYLRLLAGLERELGVAVSMDDMGSSVFETVGDVVAFVRQRLAHG